MSKFFDIHIEVGDVQTPIGNAFYARTILGNNAVKFEHQGDSPAEAINRLAVDMENTGMWGLIMQNPAGFAPYPFMSGQTAQTTSTPTTSTPPKKDAEPIRKRPVDLLSTPKGECEAICISYDNFGVSKCATMCRGKK